MTVPHKMSAMTSRLAQCGTDIKPFHLDSLSITEVESFRAVRIRAFPGIVQGTVSDLGLPVETGSCRGNNPATYCLNPNEWLQLGQSKNEQSPEPGFLRWEETDGLGILRVEGGAASWLLRKNSGLDFAITADTPDHCAQCKIGKIKALVVYHRNENSMGQFDLVVERSVMKYLWTLLISTAGHAVEMHKQYGIT